MRVSAVRCKRLWRVSSLAEQRFYTIADEETHHRAAGIDTSVIYSKFRSQRGCRGEFVVDAIRPRCAVLHPGPGWRRQRVSGREADDEPMLVGLAEEMLKGLGYEPIGYSDPPAALAAFRKAPQRFAAVITEVMPGLSGTRLTEALREHAPELPVLLVSGYGGALLASRLAAAGMTRVLTKPLQRAELARVLAELLR
jgi:CheY-like chemotaxis protein